MTTQLEGFVIGVRCLLLLALLTATAPAAAQTARPTEPHSSRATTRGGRVPVTVRIWMRSPDGRPMPVPGFRVLIVDPAGDSVAALTDSTGVAVLALRPGPYRITRSQVIEYEGVEYAWDFPIAVRSGMPVIELTQRNAARVPDERQ